MNRAQYNYYQFWLYVWVITIASISFGCGCTFQVYHRLMYLLFELILFFTSRRASVTRCWERRQTGGMGSTDSGPVWAGG